MCNTRSRCLPPALTRSLTPSCTVPFWLHCALALRARARVCISLFTMVIINIPFRFRSVLTLRISLLRASARRHGTATERRSSAFSCFLNTVPATRPTHRPSPTVCASLSGKRSALSWPLRRSSEASSHGNVRHSFARPMPQDKNRGTVTERNSWHFRFP